MYFYVAVCNACVFVFFGGGGSGFEKGFYPPHLSPSYPLPPPPSLHLWCGAIAREEDEVFLLLSWVREHQTCHGSAPPHLLVTPP